MPTKNKILVIEDDALIRSGLETLLSQSFDVVAVDGGLAGIKAAFRQQPKLILLDLMMPDLHGFQVCEMLRQDKEFDRIPIIVLTASSDAVERAKAYDLGADDFISKPFDNAELLSRIKRKLVGQKPSANTSGTLEVGNLALDPGNQSCLVDARAVHLSSLEFSLLKMLVLNAGTLVSREQIMKSIWPETDIVNRVIDPHIVSIRKKIKGFTGQLASIYRRGYILKI